MTKKSISVGIIAEDDSDVDSLKILFKRIRATTNFTFKHFVGDGCGKISRKCNSWAEQLHSRGCTSLILVHDSDFKIPGQLHQSLKTALGDSPIKNYAIIVPIQELEAWLLADAEAIKIGMNLKSIPKIKGDVEKINSPKEYLGTIIRKHSNKEKDYINTKHNGKIFERINPSSLLKCSSFVPFYNFIRSL